MTLPFILGENNDFETNLVLAINELNNLTLPKMKVTYQGADSEYHYFLMELAEESDIYTGSFVAKVPLPGKPGNFIAEIRPPFYLPYDYWEDIEVNDQAKDNDFIKGIINGTKFFGVESKVDDYIIDEGWRPGKPYLTIEQDDFPFTVGNIKYTKFSDNLPDGARYGQYRYLGKRSKIKFKVRMTFHEEYSWYDSPKLIKTYPLNKDEEAIFYQQLIEYFRDECGEDWSGSTPNSWDLDGCMVMYYNVGGRRRQENGKGVIGVDDYDHEYYLRWVCLFSPPKGTRPMGVINIVTEDIPSYVGTDRNVNTFDNLYLDQTKIPTKVNRHDWFYNYRIAFGWQYPEIDTSRYIDQFANVIQGHMLGRLPPLYYHRGRALEVRIGRSNIRCGEDIPMLPIDDNERNPLDDYHNEKDYVTFFVNGTERQVLYYYSGFDLNRIFKEEPLYIFGKRPNKDTVIQAIFENTGVMLPSEEQGLEIKYTSKENSGKNYDEYVLTSKKGFSTIVLLKDTYCTIRWK